MRAKNPSSALTNIDLTTFSLFICLTALGWTMIYSLSYDELTAGTIAGFFDSVIGKQTIWIAVSIAVFSLIMLIDWKFWQTFSYLIYAVSVLLLVAVLVFGTTIKGATSWFTFGNFSIQPAELAKFGTCLAVASYLSAYSTSLRELPAQLTVSGLFLLPVVLILLQPDAGSALVFFSFLVVLYRAGFSANYYIVALSAISILLLGLVFEPLGIMTGLLLTALGILGANLPPKVKVSKSNWFMGLGVLSVGSAWIGWQNDTYLRIVFFTVLGVAAIAGIWAWSKRKWQLVRGLSFAFMLGSFITVLANYVFNYVLQPHQQERINVWLRPGTCDPRGSLYNVLQSKMAIASGGLHGKGLFGGTMTNLNYVPEQYTDFIFCIIGEEHGFVGSFAVIGLFFFLLIRLSILAERQRSNFSKYYIYGVAGLLFFHFLINIGMTMGLLPIIGIPLPFISKGGSSLLGFTIMLAVVLKLDGNRFKI